MHKKILKTIARYFKGGSAFLLTYTTRAFGHLPTDYFPPRYFDILNESFERHEYPPIKLNRRAIKTLKSDSYSTIIPRQILRKWYKE
ncbi:MAG: hypothetical protein HKN32_00555 [Flavobacteriales bacterium]|nr:hypothetical protein [Flavobacteriales bacterium]